jgi:hypothetical protein
VRSNQELLPERNVRGTPLCFLPDAQLEKLRRKLGRLIARSLTKINQQCFWDIVHDYSLAEFELRSRSLWPHMPLAPNEGLPMRLCPPPCLSTQHATTLQAPQ